MGFIKDIITQLETDKKMKKIEERNSEYLREYFDKKYGTKIKK